MVSDLPTGLPAGASVLIDIDVPLRTSVQRPNSVDSVASSNRSTNTTSGLASMPTSPGYKAAIPPPGGGGGGGVFETVTVIADAVLTLPAASRAAAVSV